MPYRAPIHLVDARSPKAIGLRLLVIRKLSGMSQKEFARSVGATQSACGGWEKGLRPPGLKIGQALCDVYQLTLDYIYRGDAGGLPVRVEQAIRRLKDGA